MVGIANYDQASSETPVLIKLETGLAEDYFINFNRATGINQQNVLADDEVTIVKANADTKSQSYLQATLPVNESHTIVGLGKANGIVVKLLSIDKTDHDLWKAEVFIGTDQAVSVYIVHLMTHILVSSPHIPNLFHSFTYRLYPDPPPHNQHAVQVHLLHYHRRHLQLRQSLRIPHQRDLLRAQVNLPH